MIALFGACLWIEPDEAKSSTDADRDGWTTDDCDDANPSVHPGADETCTDTTDLDCDGHAGADDDDGDGTLACDDCDDSDPARFPGAAEVCDGADQDCDAKIDEGSRDDVVTWYRDTDADGFGDAGHSTERCEPGEVFADNDRGCDDTDPAVNPARGEVCRNRLDDNCDGAAPECVLEGGELVDADGGWSGVEAGSAGHDVAYAGDFDGDGEDEVVIGTYNYQDYSGAVFVFGHEYVGDLDETIRFRGPEGRIVFGLAVDGAGDIDLDGFDDIVVGAFNWDPANLWGAAFVLYGPDGSRTDAPEFVGPHPSGAAGRTVAGAGDLNDDGFPDIAVGAPSDATDGRSGTVWIVHGSGTRGALTVDHTVELLGTPNELAGYDVSGVGDIDGDGIDDLVVGCLGTDTFALVLGGTATLSGAPRYTAEAQYDYLGRATASAGDVNGDGHPDLIAGADHNHDGGGYAGAAYLFLDAYKAQGGSAASAIQYTGASTDDMAGSSVSGGDADGDGFSDLMIGAYQAGDTTGYWGSVYLVRGSPDPAPSTLSAHDEWQGPRGSAAGWSVALDGDANADGYADLLTGAPYTNASFGAAWLVLGTGP